MARDYFQDILQPAGGRQGDGGKKDGDSDRGARVAGERSIRNIAVTHRPFRPRGVSGDVRESSSSEQQPQHGKHRMDKQRRVWIWVVAVVSVVVLALVAILAARDTTITVTARSRAISFEQARHFFAYPSATSSPETLTYSVVVNDIEDSAVVPASGTEHAEEKASGNIEVFNSYSSSPVRLIKNTRFSTPDGLVFRVPATVIIPGKRGTTPGSVEVTVIADQAGEKYNIGPVDKFTLPGLKSSPDMYKTVYARSTSSFRGGFIGERPAVAPPALEAARAGIRANLENKARERARALSNPETIVFPDLVKIKYESLPFTVEAGGAMRVHEKARVEIPVLPSKLFTKMVAQGAGENVEGLSFSVLGLEGLAARQGSSAVAQSFGKDALDFTLSGNAVLVWDVDAAALAEALAGRDQGAFQAIINGFASIQDARAKIEPFWKGVFPSSSSDIRVVIVTP